jgi:hypothetical protein
VATARTLAWLDRAIWTLIFGGIVSLSLGIATGGGHVVASWSLGVLGGLAIVTGVVLIGVRSRLGEPPPGGAQSSATENRQGHP